MAIFYRTHAQSRVLEEELRACNLPYRVIGGQRFYERAEVKDVLGYLRVLANPQDDVSLLRIINTPTRGIGKTTVDRVLDAAARAGSSVWDALCHTVSAEALGKAATSKLSAFVSLIRELTTRAEGGAGPAALADAVLSETGYLENLRAEDTAEADGRIENVEELLASVREFEAEADVSTLSQYLETVTLQTNADDVDAEQKLTLMTVHAAKGLEFPVVWVAGLEERLFPLSRDDSLSREDLEEERRLAYVAFTRAEQRLFLSYACARRLHGDLLLGIPSCFLDEIPDDHVERVSRVSAVQSSRFGGFGAGQRGYSGASTAYSGGLRYEYDAPRSGHVGANASSARARGTRPGAFESVKAQRPAGAASRGFMGAAASARAKAPSPNESYVDRSDAEGSSGIYAGMRVRHAKYGEGEVKSVEMGAPPRVTVAFTGWGLKQIVASYLEPA
jgi:DNA helicase-2/ATP-dependent DNA helicase PcrA